MSQSRDLLDGLDCAASRLSREQSRPNPTSRCREPRLSRSPEAVQTGLDSPVDQSPDPPPPLKGRGWTGLGLGTGLGARRPRDVRVGHRTAPAGGVG